MRDFELQFSDKLITPWGGMALIKRMLDHLGFDQALAGAGLPQSDSNRAYRPEQLMLQTMLLVWCGANRFEHAGVTRFNRVLSSIFGINRMANLKTITRLFGKCTQTINERVFGALYRWLFEQIQIGRVTLDLDSTVITRFGEQQVGAARLQPKQTGAPLTASVDGLCCKRLHGGQRVAATGQHGKRQQRDQLSTGHARASGEQAHWVATRGLRVL